MKNIIDMSHVITPNQADDKFVIRKDPDKNDYKDAKLHEKHDFTSHTISMVTHQSTHIEAPSHIQKGAMDLSEIPLEILCGEAVILDFTDLPPKSEISVEHVAQAANRAGGIKDGDIVLCNLGYADHFGTSEYSNAPYFGTESVQWLVNSGMKLIGMDIKDIELPFDAPHKNHHILFDNNIPLVENLRGFELLRQASFLDCTMREPKSRFPETTGIFRR